VNPFSIPPPWRCWKNKWNWSGGATLPVHLLSGMHVVSRINKLPKTRIAFFWGILQYQSEGRGCHTPDVANPVSL